MRVSRTSCFTFPWHTWLLPPLQLHPTDVIPGAPQHPHNAARETFVDIDGIVQPAPAPRFSATPGAVSRPPAERGEHTDEVLADFGFDAGEVAALHEQGVIRGVDAA